MASYNRIVLVGRLTRDPEIKFSTSGTQIATFSLAVDRDFKSQNNQGDNVDFINIVAFGKKAEFAGNYLAKGKLILVEGSLRINRWKTQTGESRNSASVVADTMRFMETKSRQSAANNEPGIPLVDDNTVDTSGDITFFGSDNGNSGNDEIPF